MMQAEQKSIVEQLRKHSEVDDCQKVREEQLSQVELSTQERQYGRQAKQVLGDPSQKKDSSMEQREEHPSPF